MKPRDLESRTKDCRGRWLNSRDRNEARALILLIIAPLDSNSPAKAKAKARKGSQTVFRLHHRIALKASFFKIKYCATGFAPTQQTQALHPHPLRSLASTCWPRPPRDLGFVRHTNKNASLSLCRGGDDCGGCVLCNPLGNQSPRQTESGSPVASLRSQVYLAEIPNFPKIKVGHPKLTQL